MIPPRPRIGRVVAWSMTRLVSSFTFATLLLGCQQYPEIIDEDRVCVSVQEVDGQLRLFVEADSGGCAADHEGASLECTISVDGQLAHIETVFQDGKDPDDSCAGPLETTCAVDVEPGTYTVEYADEQYDLVVPGGERICIPGGGDGETG
jgi:hypothetical protein